MIRPKYPIYVPSRNRSHVNLTVRTFLKEGVPFYLVVEPQDEDAYRARFPEAKILILPDNNVGLVFVRNWIFEHAAQGGAERHWQIDDNIGYFCRMWHGRRIPCDASIALRVCEDFADRYENVALAGLNYEMFVMSHKPEPVFRLNVHVYSCTLIRNDLPYRFRPAPGGPLEPANEDVDMCLQVLAGGYCTILLNAFMAKKRATMTVKGGQTDVAYDGDGRLRMARALERVWPGVVVTKRRFRRPQHVVNWAMFTTPLKLREGVQPLDLNGEDLYPMRLASVGTDVKSPKLRALQEAYNRERGR